MKRSGVTVYRGPSLLDASKIRAILTYGSSNAKTGAMAQLWIVPDRARFANAAREGTDEGVCGGCLLRPSLGGECYVSPRPMFGMQRALAAGAYPVLPTLADVAQAGSGEAIRLGAWGDPAAIPVAVLDALVSGARRWTGYTHQWREGRAQAYRHLLMASCETAGDAWDAALEGWRTFRTLAQDAEPIAGVEISCPASEEAGHKVQCIDCGLCDGAHAMRHGVKSIAIKLHGFRVKRESAGARA